MPLTIDQIWQRILEKEPVIFDVDDEPCRLCGTVTDLRCGVCHKCQGRIRATDDLTEVYEYANPRNRWPFVYRNRSKFVREFLGGGNA